MKKSFFSVLTTWTVRILLFIVVLIGVCLLMLSTMGGTTESHRKGLEQAFSDSLNADVILGRLDEFNIIPQLTMKVGDVQGRFRDTENQFLIDKLKISFGLKDLMTGRRKIEDFQIDNFRFAKDSTYDFRVGHAGINDKSAAFIAKGQYDRKDFDFSMSVGKISNSRPVYYFSDENPFNGKYGALAITGKIVPATGKNAPIFQDLKISDKNGVIATGQGRHEGSYKIVIDCIPDKKIEVAAQSDLKNLAKLSFVELSGACPE